MNLRNASRRLVLRIPRIRRYYDYVNGLRAEHDSALKQLAAASKVEAELRAKFSQIDAKLKERDALELRLYALRADHQRAVRVADQFRAQLRSALEANELLARDKRLLERRLAEHEDSKRNRCEVLADLWRLLAR